MTDSLVPRPFLRTREELEIRGRRKARERSGKSSSAHAEVNIINLLSRAPRILVMISVRYEMRPNFAAKYLGPEKE